MGFSCGLIGLPNVGKSTLFNAVTRTAQAAVANYPFCTIEPNIAEVPVPDDRLGPIAEAAGTTRIVPTKLGFVDIAGLVRGASKGEGLGNRFLSQIREVDAITHVVRCFTDTGITHVDGAVDPIRDLETIATELMLADLERAESHLEALARKIRAGDREGRDRARLLEAAQAELAAGRPARRADIPETERDRFHSLGLLTAKPMLYVANVEDDAAADGNAASRQLAGVAAAEGVPCIIVAASFEAEIASFEDADRTGLIQDAGLAESGLDRLARTGYGALELITYFTAGPKEVCARTLRRGATSLDAAGRIHTDFARGFIRAEVIPWEEYVELGSEVAARDAGRIRAEGRDYAVADGDVIRFRFNT